MRIAYSKIKDVATTFSSQSFFEDRTAIQSAMFDKVSAALSSSTNGAIELMNLQLRQIALDPTVLASNI